MGRRPRCAREGLNKGAWTAQEDKILTNYVNIHGGGKWRDLPQRAGLNRCGKSCRLRWLNYLRPDIKRGNISVEEADLIIKMHKLLGNRWSLIAGRLPGRTDNEIKNFWNTNVRKRIQGQKGRNNAKKCNNWKEKKAMENSSTAFNPGATAEKHQVIRTKAVRCTRVFIPQIQDNQTVKNNEVPTWCHDSQPDSSNFLMDFNLGDLFISDVLNMEFCQEKESVGNENGVGGDYVGKIMSPCSDFLVHAYEEFPSNSTDELMQDNWKPLQSHEDLDLMKFASFLDSEEEWIK